MLLKMHLELGSEQVMEMYRYVVWKHWSVDMNPLYSLHGSLARNSGETGVGKDRYLQVEQQIE